MLGYVEVIHGHTVKRLRLNPVMNCVACSRVHFYSFLGDTGGTEDLKTSYTGTEGHVVQTEKAVYHRLREGKRNFKALSKQFWLSRLPSLCHGKASPSLVVQLCSHWRKAIVVVHTLLRQACLFKPGSAPKAICLICALRLSMRRMLVLFVVRGEAAFQVLGGGWSHPVIVREALVKAIEVC